MWLGVVSCQVYTSVRQHYKIEHWAPCRNQTLSWYDWKIVESDVKPEYTHNPSCKTPRNCVEIHNMNLQRNWGGRPLAVKAEQTCVHIFGNEGRPEMWNNRSFAVKAEGKCGGRTSHIWQWRQIVSGEAGLQIFGSQDWAKVQKQNWKSLEVQAEVKCGSETSHLWKPWQNNCGKRNFRTLPVKTERKCGSRTSHIWQSRQSGSAEAELHIFGSQCRTKVRTWNVRSLAVKTERKRNFRSLAVKAEQKCGSGIRDL